MKVKKNATALSLEERLKQALIPVEEQPYEIPKNWCWTKLESIANWGSGGTPSRKYPEYYTGNIPWIKTGELNNAYIYETEEHISENAIANSNAKLFPINTVIIAMYGATIGKVGIMGVEATTNQACACAVCSSAIYHKYLFYYAISQRDSFIKKGKGGAQPNISQEVIKQHEIPLAPLAEQKRIVDTITELFADLDKAAENARQIVDGYKQRKAAILADAFAGRLTEQWRETNRFEISTWKPSVIGDIANVKGGKRVPKGMSLTTEDTGHPYIKAGNLKCGTVIDDGIMFVPDDVLHFIKNYTVNAGDVYITNVGACIGDCGVIPQKYDGANLTENAVKITNLKCDGSFLAYFLASNQVQATIKTLIASATLGKLSIANIKTIEVNLPTLPEQQEIVRILDELLSKEQRICEAAEEMLEKIDLMKKSILAKAFRGTLGTNDPADEPATELLKETLK